MKTILLIFFKSRALDGAFRKNLTDLFCTGFNFTETVQSIKLRSGNQRFRYDVGG